MAKYKRKSNEVEAVNWEEFIAFGKHVTNELIEDMPWSFNYKGHPVTHVNNERYYISCSVGGGSYHMEPGKMLVMYDDGKVNTLTEHQFNQFYELDVQPEESVTRLATEPYLEFMEEFTNHDTFKDCNFHKVKYDKETGHPLKLKINTNAILGRYEFTHIETLAYQYSLDYQVKRSGAGLCIQFMSKNLLK